MSLFAYVLLENIKYTVLVTAIVLVVFFPWWDEYVVNFYDCWWLRSLQAISGWLADRSNEIFISKEETFKNNLHVGMWNTLYDLKSEIQYEQVWTTKILKGWVGEACLHTLLFGWIKLKRMKNAEWNLGDGFRGRLLASLGQECSWLVQRVGWVGRSGKAATNKLNCLL